MPDPSAPSDHLCARLQQQIALSIMVDELAITTLARAAAAMRAVGDPETGELEHMIRSHRIGILKQRAILGAAGIDV